MKVVNFFGNGEIIMKKLFLGINIILLWITLWHFYRFPITENMSLSLYNKKVYRRLIPNTIDPIVKSSDLLFNINFGGKSRMMQEERM